MAHPVRFGGSAGLFGLYRPPTSQGDARSSGVVLCNPIGWEEQASNRVYRYLAIRLADLGFDVLQFDYHGMGDSLGAQTDGDRVEAWLASIRAALDWMHESARTSLVSLVGTQLGALLALSALSPDHRVNRHVASIVLWAGSSSGAAFLRQAKAFRLMSATAAQPPQDTIQTGELCLGEETLRDLSALEPRHATLTSIPHALVVDRHARAEHSKLLVAMRGRSPNLHYAGGPALSQFTRNWLEADIPTAGADAICDWLCRVHPIPAKGLAEALHRAPPSSPLPRGLPRESHVYFDEQRLLGVFTQPSEGSAVRKTTVLMVSSGWSNRTGPNRLHVQWARTLAEHGFRSFRFDFTGMGDANDGAAPTDLDPYGARPIADTQAAIRWLREVAGSQSLCLLGVCSGAYLSFELAAQVDDAMTLVLINPQLLAQPVGGAPAVTITSVASDAERPRIGRLRKVFPRPWVVWMKSHRSLARRVFRSYQYRARMWLRGHSPVENKLRNYLARGAHILLIVGKDDPASHYVLSQLGSDPQRLQRWGDFTFSVCSETDHTFSDYSARHWLTKEIVDYLVRAAP